MKTFFTRIGPLILTAMFLAACEPDRSLQESARVEAQPVSLETIEKSARGFEAGNMMSTRRVYVFFDPQCPHCGNLWHQTKQLHKQARFTWIPVAILNQASLVQGAALLQADNPAGAMEVHEELLRTGQGGLTATPGVPDDELRDAILKNTQLMASFGARSVPYIVGRHAQTGQPVEIEGFVPPDVLAAQLGWS